MELIQWLWKYELFEDFDTLITQWFATKQPKVSSVDPSSYVSSFWNRKDLYALTFSLKVLFTPL